MPSKRSIFVALTLATLLAGCDRNAAAPPALMAINSTPAKIPVASSMSVRVLASLAPARATMLAAMPDGAIYVVQTGSGGDARSAVVIPANANTPTPTPLTADSVLRSLGVARGKSSNGRFTSLAPCADGRLAFSFAGFDGTRPIAAIGTFSPADAGLFVSVDQISLSSIDKTLGRAVDPTLATDNARPTLFTFGDDAWLWRASDREVKLLTVVGLREGRPKLAATSSSLDEVKDLVERSAWEWSATATRGEFLLTDTTSRWIRRIDASGTLSHVARFDETITTISPAVLDAGGRVVVIGNDRDGVATCALSQDNDAFKAILRDKFLIDGLPANAPLRLDRLYPIPGEANAFIAYEATSGAVVRVTLK